MSDSELSRPGAGNAPDDGEETVGLVERLSSERRTIDKSLVDLEKKIGDQNIKIKTLEGKISGKRRELEIQIEKLKAEAEDQIQQLNLEIEKARLEKEALERQRERKNDELKNVNRKLSEVWEKKMNGESIKNAKVLTDITDSEYNTHDITYNTSKTNEF